MRLHLSLSRRNAIDHAKRVGFDASKNDILNGNSDSGNDSKQSKCCKTFKTMYLRSLTVSLELYMVVVIESE